MGTPLSLLFAAGASPGYKQGGDRKAGGETTSLFWSRERFKKKAGRVGSVPTSPGFPSSVGHPRCCAEAS